MASQLDDLARQQQQADDAMAMGVDPVQPSTPTQPSFAEAAKNKAIETGLAVAQTPQTIAQTQNEFWANPSLSTFASAATALPGVGTAMGPMGATTSEIENLIKASRSEATGMDNNTLMHLYGWARHPVTGQWTSEFSDVGARYKPPNISKDVSDIKDPQAYWHGTLGQFFHHPEYERRYPGAMDLPFRFYLNNPGHMASYNTRTGEFTMRNPASYPTAARFAQFMGRDVPLESLLHEGQHHIANIEGMGVGYSANMPGGRPRYLADVGENLARLISENRLRMTPEQIRREGQTLFEGDPPTPYRRQIAGPDIQRDQPWQNLKSMTPSDAEALRAQFQAMLNERMRRLRNQQILNTIPLRPGP